MTSSPPSSSTALGMPLSASASEILASQAIPSVPAGSSSSPAAAPLAAAEASTSSTAAYPLFPSAGRLIGYGDLVIMQLVRSPAALLAQPLCSRDRPANLAFGTLGTRRTEPRVARACHRRGRCKGAEPIRHVRA